MKFQLRLVLLAILASGCLAEASCATAQTLDAQSNQNRNQIQLGIQLDIQLDIQRRALQYFLDNANPQTGQVLDEACNFSSTCKHSSDVASIAATGFGLAVVANAAEHRWVSQMQARDYVYKAIAFAQSKVPRRRGWFTHFYNWQTGQRVWSSEYSTIDTAFFLAGALYASHVLQDEKIATLTKQIYEDTDFWDAMTNGGALPHKRTLSMAYFEKEGYTIAQWDMYAEQMVLLILGLGHPTHPLPPETWLAFRRDPRVAPSASKDSLNYIGLSKPLFVHQYSQLFLDLRTFQDGLANYFENSTAVSRYHRDMTKSNSRDQTLRAGFWGFSAGVTPNGYHVATALNHSSTVCIGCALASAIFLPEDVLSDATQWINGPYSTNLWGRYGFTDSIDLDQKWFSDLVLAITVGPEYLALANLNDTTSIWRVFMQIPEIKAGLARAAHASGGGVL